MIAGADVASQFNGCTIPKPALLLIPSSLCLTSSPGSLLPWGPGRQLSAPGCNGWNARTGHPYPRAGSGSPSCPTPQLFAGLVMENSLACCPPPSPLYLNPYPLPAHSRFLVSSQYPWTLAKATSAGSTTGPFLGRIPPLGQLRIAAPCTHEGDWPES